MFQLKKKFPRRQVRVINVVFDDWNVKISPIKCCASICLENWGLKLKYIKTESGWEILC